MDIEKTIKALYDLREHRAEDPSNWRTKSIVCWLNGFREIIGEDKLDMLKVEKYCNDEKKKHETFTEILADRVKLGGIKEYAEFYHYPLDDHHHMQLLIKSQENSGVLFGRNYVLNGENIILPIIHLKMSYKPEVVTPSLASGFHDVDPWRQLDIPGITEKGYKSFEKLVEYAKL